MLLINLFILNYYLIMAQTTINYIKILSYSWFLNELIVSAVTTVSGKQFQLFTARISK